MAVDHGPATSVHQDPPYRHMRPGHFVIVGGETSASTSWWMGQVVSCEGAIAEPSGDAYCQLTDVESGLQRWIQAREVTQVIWAMDGWPDALAPS